jgi:hypothetical protein
MSENSPTISPDVRSDRVPLRIDARTIILIPPGVDPEKRKAKFIRKINSSKSNDINNTNN